MLFQIIPTFEFFNSSLSFLASNICFWTPDIHHLEFTAQYRLGAQVLYAGLRWAVMNCSGVKVWPCDAGSILVQSSPVRDSAICCGCRLFLRCS